MPRPTPTTVCFDLGGVVVRICRTFEEAALAAGVPLRAVDARPEAHARRQALIEAFQLGALEADDFHRRLSAAFDGVYSAAELERVHAAVLVGEYPDIHATIRAIIASGLRTACLSNTNAAHWDGMAGLPALCALHDRCASHLWQLMKPAEAIFRRFERESGARGRDIVYFDDLEVNVAAALAVGWDAVLIDHAGDTAAQVRAALRARGVGV